MGGGQLRGARTKAQVAAAPLPATALVPPMHRTVLTVFPLNLHTNIITRIQSIEGEGKPVSQ